MLAIYVNKLGNNFESLVNLSECDCSWKIRLPSGTCGIVLRLQSGCQDFWGGSLLSYFHFTVTELLDLKQHSTALQEALPAIYQNKIDKFAYYFVNKHSRLSVPLSLLSFQEQKKWIAFYN